MIPGTSLRHQQALGSVHLRKPASTGQESFKYRRSITLYPLLYLHRRSLPMDMVKPFTHRGRSTCHVVSRFLGETDNRTSTPLFFSSSLIIYLPLPGLLLLVPPAPTRLKPSKPPKPSSHHEPPRARHTRERDPPATQLSARPSSLPRLASNFREGRQTLG
jgi:hypothetical protein